MSVSASNPDLLITTDNGNSEEETGDLIYKHSCAANARDAEAKKAADPTAAADDDSKEEIGESIYKRSHTFKDGGGGEKKAAAMTAERERPAIRKQNPNISREDAPVPKEKIAASSEAAGLKSGSLAKWEIAAEEDNGLAPRKYKAFSHNGCTTNARVGVCIKHGAPVKTCSGGECTK